MVKRLAIDPGDVHVGWARHHPTPAWVIESGEWAPQECIDNVVVLMTQREVDELVIEEFILYDRDIKKQAWSKLQTSQLIGGLKVVAYFFGVPVIEQSATIKKPTRKQLQARGIAHTGRVIHAKDAELHLWYRILRRGAEGEG